jgi:hypothetical protein
MYVCTFCGEYALNEKKLLHHIKFLHSHEPNFALPCRLCGQIFKKFDSYKSHLRRKHDGTNDLQDDQEDLHQEFEQLNDSGVGHEIDANTDDDSEEEEENETNMIDRITRFIALFILKTKEENQLNQPTMSSILNNTETLVDESLQVFKEEVKTCLQNNGINTADVDGLEDILNRRSVFSEALTPISTEYHQVKYFVENFNFVVSGSI